jgi:hypothetical protein
VRVGASLRRMRVALKNDSPCSELNTHASTQCCATKKGFNIRSFLLLLYLLHALCRKDSSRNIAYAALHAKSAKMKVRESPYAYLSTAQESDLGAFERHRGSIAPYSCKLLYIACSNHNLCQDRSQRNLNTRSYAHRAETSRKFRGAIVPY